MSFTQEIKFSDLTKLLEAVSTNKITMKKRDEYVKSYFGKLKEFRDVYVKNNKSSVRFYLSIVHQLTTSLIVFFVI